MNNVKVSICVDIGCRKIKKIKEEKYLKLWKKYYVFRLKLYDFYLMTK